jgi:hypothetical protein
MVLDLGSVKDEWQQSCHHLLEIAALSKQSEQDYCHGGETNSQGTTSDVAVSAHLPVDVLDDLHKISGS